MMHMFGGFAAPPSALLLCSLGPVPLLTASALLFAVGSRELARQYHGSVVNLIKGCGDNGRAIGSNGGANGHEEPVAVNQRHRAATESMPTQMWPQILACTALRCAAFHWAQGRSAQCW